MSPGSGTKQYGSRSKELDKNPLRKKLFLASFYAFKEDLKNQIVTYELSKTKQSSI